PALLLGGTGTGSGVLTYMWPSSNTGSNGPWIAAAGTNTTQNYQPGVLTLTTYYKRVTISTLNGTLCRDTSNCITITIDNVTAGTISADQTIGTSTVPVLLLGTTGTGSGVLTYLWLSSTTGCNGPWSVAARTIPDHHQNSGVLTLTTYYKRVTISTLSGTVCRDTSNCITITIDNVTAGTISADQT